MGWVWRARMLGDTVFRRFAALPRAIVAHLIAAEPPCRPVFMPHQTQFRSYQRCCRGAGGRRKALLLACRRWPTPFPPSTAQHGPAWPRVASLVAAESPQCRVFRPHQTWFRSYQKCCRGQSPRAASPSPPHRPGVASLVAAKPGSAEPKSGMTQGFRSYQWCGRLVLVYIIVRCTRYIRYLQPLGSYV